MIEKTRIAYAEKILEMILADKRAEKVEASVEMFENCREQGYRLAIYLAEPGAAETIAFSENRNSDDIVVYYSTKHEEAAFNYSDEFWLNSRYFRYDDFEGAVDYIFELMGVN